MEEHTVTESSRTPASFAIPRTTDTSAHGLRQTTLAAFFSRRSPSPDSSRMALDSLRNSYSRVSSPSYKMNRITSQSVETERHNWDAGRQQRREIAKETVKVLPGILKNLPTKPDGYKWTPVEIRRLDPKYCPNLNGQVQVVNGDTFDTAIRFDELFPRKNPINTKPVCVLNMASAIWAGGGFRNGSLAQEEELCYRSSLIFTLKLRFYPMKDLEAIYSPTVVIIRKGIKKDYELLDLKKPRSLPVVSVISMAALYNPGLWWPASGPPTYEDPADREIMKEKMRVILRMAAHNKHRRLVLGALGCGAFNNPREEVANCWAEVLKEKEFRGWWETIAFAIVPPPPSLRERSNLEIFEEVLDGLSI